MYLDMSVQAPTQYDATTYATTPVRVLTLLCNVRAYSFNERNVTGTGRNPDTGNRASR